MRSLQESSVQISAQLLVLEEELADQIKRTKENIDTATEEFKEASAQGDRSENAAFHEAKQQLQLLNTNLAQLQGNLNALKNKVNENNYYPIGLIVVYSTVRIVIMNTGEERVIKLFPKGVSDVEKGIIAIDSKLGAALLQKEVGNVVVLDHRVTGAPIKYKILEIY